MNRHAAPPLTLYTFAMSHYSEKIRWTLDTSQIPYKEVCMTPAFHVLPALRMGGRGKTTLPIVRLGKQSIQDSPRILDWLIDRYGPLAVLPVAELPRIRDVEQRFDAIGKDVARFLYANSFGTADKQILDLWIEHATPIQSTALRVGYPIVRAVFRQKLQINARRAALARERITNVIDWLESQLSSGKTYLVGDRFSAADITAAALLAPIACPPEHPVYGRDDFKHSMKQAIAPWEGRPALDWVRQTYARHRGDFRDSVLSPANRLRA